MDDKTPRKRWRALRNAIRGEVREEEFIWRMEDHGGRNVPPEVLRDELGWNKGPFYGMSKRLIRAGRIARRRWRNRVFYDLIIDGENAHNRARRIAEEKFREIERRGLSSTEVLGWMGYHAGPLSGSVGPVRPRRGSPRIRSNVGIAPDSELAQWVDAQWVEAPRTKTTDR